MLYAVIWVHFIADFMLQTDKMATNKSTSWKWLSSHVSVYMFSMMIFFGWEFAVINAAAHFVVDAITSRMTSYLWKKGDRHNFFVVIGLDQVIHTSILIATLPLAYPIWNYLT